MRSMIIVRLSGGMGNQMFQYALGRALSLKYDVPLKLDTKFLLQRVALPDWLRPKFKFREFDLDIFNIHTTIAEPSDMKWWQRPILFRKVSVLIDAVLRKIPILPGWEKKFSFDEAILSIGPNAYLVGFWQCEKYFLDCKDVIKQDFMLCDPLSPHSEMFFQEIKNSESVCIHVRRADYVDNALHAVAGKDYYDRALAMIVQKSSVGKIYVFSDDIEWCRKNLQFPIPSVFMGNEYAGEKGREHFALMSACKHFIIPNSTFSWWAAWLGDHPDKIVVAPKQWFIGTSITSDDLIPLDWIQI